MDKTEREIRRMQDAEQLINNALMVEAKAHIEAELWRIFRETPPQDRETLEFVKGMQYFHEKYFAFMARVISDGKVAMANQKAKKTLKERFLG